MRLCTNSLRSTVIVVGIAMFATMALSLMPGWAMGLSAGAQEDVAPPLEMRTWRDPGSGLTVRRITPTALSAGLPYHHQKAFTSDSRWMVFTSADMDIYAFDLKKEELRRLTRNGGCRLLGTIPGRSALLVRFGSGYQEIPIPDGQARRVAPAPEGIDIATVPDITSNGRYLVGACIEITDEERARVGRPRPGWVRRLWEMHLKNTLFKIDLETGEREEFFSVRSWIDHLQCSPTDPNLLTYVDQGGGQLGNWIHIVRLDGSGHGRVADGGAHHIWSPDGNHIFFNDERRHAAPWEYWRWDRRTGRKERVLPKEEWNFHFVPARSGRHLVGDGTWADDTINLYGLSPRGSWEKTRLCKRITANLRTENQARFAPDEKSVFFNGDVDGVKAIFQVFLTR